jgi:hypothetical protein
MHYHVTEFYKQPNGFYEGPILITASWEAARSSAIERFFELYHDFCNQVGDRLLTFISIGNEPSQTVPLLAIREHLNDPAIIDRCANGEQFVVSMDGGDYVSIQLIE